MNELGRAQGILIAEKDPQVFLANPCLLSFLFTNSLPTPHPNFSKQQRAHPLLLMLRKG